MDRKPAPDGGKQDGDKPLGRDERVSLYPLDPVEALRALMKTPRPGRVQDKPTGDKGKK